MRIAVHVWKSKEDEDDHDLFFPFVARDDSRCITMRGETEEAAADNVVGAVLCCLGQQRRPPRELEFKIKKGYPA
jgi:hypothetical protein